MLPAFISVLPVHPVRQPLCISRTSLHRPLVFTRRDAGRLRLHMSAAMPPANPRPSSALSSTKKSLPLLPSISKFMTLRNRIFLTMLLSYATYYLTRYSFPFAAPLMQKSLGLSLQQIGLISSSFPLVYGISKLFAGVLSDLASPRRILSIGLLLAAVCNVLFASVSSVPLFALIWALNGFVSSVGFPACAKLLSSWFGPEERGTYWGLLNVSLNVGGALSPIIVSSAAATMGWRYGMLVPAAIALVMSLVSFVAISDAPKSVLEPDVDSTKLANAAVESKQDKKISSENSEKPPPMKAFATQISGGILSRPAVWSLGMAYFFVYIVRHALSTWPVFFLMQARGVSSLAEAAVRVSGLEIGGLVGSVTSGYLSDRLIRANPNAGAIGQRVRVIMLYLCMTAICSALFFATPGTATMLPLQWGLFALTGVGLYGPQLLVGLCSAECVDKRFAGTSNGFVGLAAYLGAALAGFPLSIVVKRFGWSALYSVVMGCCVIVALMLVPLLRAKSFDQLAAEKKQ